MTQPLVSVLIPCHNAAPFLAATLDSACAQTWPRCEVILVDDGSTDDSLTVARRYEPCGLRILQQPNRGAAAARNAAIRASAGDYLQFLDADDLLAPEKVERHLERAIRLPPFTSLTGRWGRFTDDPARAWFRDENPLFADLAPADYLRRYGSHDCMMHPAAWLVPRAVAEAAGPWDERLTLNDDGEYFARIAARSAQIAHCPTAVSYYRSALPSSLSRGRSRRHLESAHLALTLIVHQMRDLADEPAMRRAAADLCQRFAYDYYPYANDLTKDAEQRSRELGGSPLAPLGGRGFHLMRRVVGWKLARRLQLTLGRFPT